MSTDTLTHLVTFTSLGSAALGYGLWQRWREERPRCWLLVPGIILNARIEGQYAGRGRCQYVTGVEYEYRYNNRNFKSHRIRMANYSSGSKQEADTLSSRYPVGGSVTVFVDPEKPESASKLVALHALREIPTAPCAGVATCTTCVEPAVIH